MATEPQFDSPGEAEAFYTRLALIEEAAEADEPIPYWTCPYLARYESRPGHDPHAICAFGCWDEPVCVTGGPWEERTVPDA
jgi:hypothetical protein